MMRNKYKLIQLDIVIFCLNVLRILLQIAYLTVALPVVMIAAAIFTGAAFLLAALQEIGKYHE